MPSPQRPGHPAVAPNPRQLILNLLLAAGDAPLSARELVASCALLGIRENSTRVALARLAAAQRVEADGRGTWRLGPGAATLAADVATWRQAGKRLRHWRGSWIAVHVGALGRSDRVALRARERALSLLGLRELDAGFFVRPDNLAGGVDAARERLLKLGLEASAAVFVASDFDGAREGRARALWDTRALDAGYRRTARQLDDWLAQAGKLDAQAAARESFLLGNAAIRQLVFDPLLPAPLVDADARSAFIEAVQRFDNAGQRIWRALWQGTRSEPATLVLATPARRRRKENA
jgi:phenylacetic acid degradation operon negative regulatory protein